MLAWLGFGRMLHVALFCIVALLVWLGSREVSNYVTSRPAYCVDVSKLSVGELPEWCSAELRQAILSKPLAEGVYSTTDPNLTAFLGRSCEANPWVRKVNAVRRAYPDRISVSLELRRPLCSVEARGGLYVLDKDAVRLPMAAPANPEQGTRLVAIKGVRSAPPAVGKPWDDEAIRGAISTLLALQANSQIASSVHIAAIDVSNYGGRVNPRDSEIVLHTDANQEILWGRAPTRRAFGELSVSEKLRSLERLLASSACPAGARLNIRFPGGGIIQRRENL
jgi:cell division septal protein FtsQ